ncbi:vacuolar protein sorting [Thozetella sp. PMI_491]|nr:vacuolar protein sorting [Thozetella sp. PMI_491]
MRTMRARGAFRAAALLTAALWATPLAAKNENPTLSVNTFDHAPRNLNYFDDSDIVLFQDYVNNNVYRSADGGAKWDKVDAVPNGEAFALFMHEYDSKRAYILTSGIQHYRTADQGKTWEMFQTDAEMSMFRGDILQFHASDPDRIIFNGMECQGIFCEEVAMYTTDGFKSAAKYLRGNTAGCWWVKSSPTFSTGQESLDKTRILCIVRDSFSPFKQDQRLMMSDNFFQATSSDGVIKELEPDLDMNKPVQGIVNVAAVKKYLMVATTSMNTDEMALYVTDDTEKWHRAIFPEDHRVLQEAYTVLESTEYSIQIDVMTTRPSNPMGVMFTSNSNGTYFTRNIEHTNRSPRGHVDFEKISGIQGIFMVNKVDNWKEVEKEANVPKEILSGITFDDGRTFQDVKVGDDRLHLHSVTDLNNVGRVFSSPAPGLVLGNGNTGKFLKGYWDSSLFVSDNAGMTWSKALDGPHKYEFGDQGSILVAVKDSEKYDVSEIRYSLNHGKDWQTEALPDVKMRPAYLTTVQDSTSLKFVLVGEKDRDGPYYVISIDFDGLHEATCKDSDLEDWSARVDDQGKPTCLMGHTQSYRRRKKDAECFMKQEFRDPVAETTDCDCEDHDFECDFNFKWDSEKKECIPAGPIPAPEGACSRTDDKTFKGSSGWRLIPGNTCKRKGGHQKDDPIDRECSDAKAPPSVPASGDISQKKITFDGSWMFPEIHYLERGDSSSIKDETIIVRPVKIDSEKHVKNGPIYISHNHGKDWKVPKELEDVQIWAIIPHRHFKDMVFFLTYDEKVMYTIDSGEHFHSFKAPYKAMWDVKDGPFPLAFHPDKKDWLLWTGRKCDGETCYAATSVTTDRGDNWETVSRYAERCEFTGGTAFEKYGHRDKQQVVCLQHAREDSDGENPLELVSSDDWFKNTKTQATNVKDFATMAEFIVVATEDKEKGTLQAHASVDGKRFADAHFPPFLDVPHQHGYTVLESSTHAVNLFLVTQTKSDRQHGTLLKSNSNGTSYVLSIDGVNCDWEYYVDFEKMLGVEGVAVVNVVANPDEDAPKKLQTKITHNDGATWRYLPPPKTDAEGKKFSCSSASGDEKCALHIHGYTERRDRRKTYSSASAVGLMFAVGNVGSELGSVKDVDTYMTTDAGITWKQAKKGRWTWAFGDQGSVIVLVQTAQEGKTDTLYYSTDEGASWKEYKFSEEKVPVTDISTLRSGGSRNFLLWTEVGETLSSINVDFSGLTDKMCENDEYDAGKSDYYIWSPEHPETKDGCLFGHQTQYLRKKPERNCYNDFKMQHFYGEKNCTCSRQDYECDYNYEVNSFGLCELVKGLQALDKETWCKEHPGEFEFYEPTGYRRLPLTTCKDGKEFDKASTPSACPGHEDEFDKAHAGPSGVVLFFAITIPFALAGAIGWYVWRNWSGKFGQIRLGEPGGGGFGGAALDTDQPWVKYPIVAVSAVVAAVAALPLVVGAVWRMGKGAAERWGLLDGSRGSWSRLGGDGTRRFTTRDSFARGRGDYAIVDDDEGELLGDDSDEDV